MFKTVVAATVISAAVAWRPAPKKSGYPAPVYARGPRDFEAGKEIKGLRNFEKKLDIKNKKDLNLNLHEIEGRGNFEKNLDIDNKRELNLNLGEIEQNGDMDFNLDFERNGDFEAKGAFKRGGFNSYGIHRQAAGPIKPRGVVGPAYGYRNLGGASSRQATDNYGGSGAKGGLQDIGNKFNTREVKRAAPAPKKRGFADQGDSYGRGFGSYGGGQGSRSFGGFGGYDGGYGVRSYNRGYDDYDSGYGDYNRGGNGGYNRGYDDYDSGYGRGGYGGYNRGGYGGYNRGGYGG
jgi:hypothetical protein